MTDAVSVAKQVLAADAAPGVTLSLAPGMPPVKIDTQVADARRNYMRLAALIHPDKLKGSFDKATEAFQMLVRAFEAFADPAARKKAFARVAKQADSAARRVVKTTKVKPVTKKARLEKPKSKPKPSQKTKRPTKKARSESEDDEDDDVSDDASESDEDEDEESVSSGEDDEFHFDEDDEVEPVVSNSRAPIGEARTGDDYAMTIIGCPNCRSRWEPDTRQQYSLFMGEWGKKVHCQLCLLVFGSATALHNCPHCQATFDYDASMYNTVTPCTRCKHNIGFPYYPVSQHLIDQVHLDQWRARKEAERAQERERRRRERDEPADPAAAAEAQKQMWIGSCIVNEECPLCRARVRRQHRQHIEECAKKNGPTSAGTAATVVARPETREKPKTSPAKRTRAAATAKSPAASKPKAASSVAKKAVVAKPPAAKPKPKAASKTKLAAGKKTKRRGSSEDDDDEDSASGDESSEDESSADDDDDFSSDDE